MRLILLKNKDRISNLIRIAGQSRKSDIQAVSRGMRDRLDCTDWVNEHQIAIIQGDKDPVMPVTLMEKKLKELNISPDYFLIKNCGHMSFYEQPEILFSLIEQLCNRAKSAFLSENTSHNSRN